jgi:transcriptional regulator with XRE-family HTH domain
MPVNAPDLSPRTRFAKNLRRLRIEKGFRTAREFSAALGIDENRYTRYERGEVEPNLALFLKICDALHVSPNELLAVE